LKLSVDREESQEHDGDGVSGKSLLQTFWRIGEFHLSDREAVEPDENAVQESDVGLGRIRTLILQSVFLQPAIQIGLATVECFERMVAAELFDGPRLAHRLEPVSKKPGVVRSSFNRGSGCGGASRAA